MTLITQNLFSPACVEIISVTPDWKDRLLLILRNHIMSESCQTRMLGNNNEGCHAQMIVYGISNL